MIPRGRHYVIFRVTGCSSAQGSGLTLLKFVPKQVYVQNLYQTLIDFANKNFTVFLHMKGKFILFIQDRRPLYRL